MTPTQVRSEAEGLLEALKTGEPGAKDQLLEIVDRAKSELTTQDPSEIQDLIWLRTRLPKEIEEVAKVAARPRRRTKEPVKNAEAERMADIIQKAQELHRILTGRHATASDALDVCLQKLEDLLRDSVPELFRKRPDNVIPLRRAN